ncbi:MAG: response regulator [Rickettsiales bacterium]|nr:response regulator [Rickettsiales bacterium]
MAFSKNMHILVVDDYKTVIRIIKNLLGQIGFTNLHEAMDGTQALEILNTQKIDFVISDWNMEPMSGYELLKKIRNSDKYYKDIPFMMVTAETKAENVVMAKKAGVNNYIIKPFNLETMKLKIGAVFNVQL